MLTPTLVTVVPIGEFDTPSIRAEFDSIIQMLKDKDAEPLVAGPVSDETAAREGVEASLSRNPDLLLLVPLRGLSAQAMEAAALASRAPCLIWPIHGRFAL